MDLVLIQNPWPNWPSRSQSELYLISFVSLNMATTEIYACPFKTFVFQKIFLLYAYTCMCRLCQYTLTRLFKCSGALCVFTPSITVCCDWHVILLNKKRGFYWHLYIVFIYKPNLKVHPYLTTLVYKGVECFVFSTKSIEGYISPLSFPLYYLKCHQILYPEPSMRQLHWPIIAFCFSKQNKY